MALADQRSGDGSLAFGWRKEKGSEAELDQMARWQLGQVSAVGLREEIWADFGLNSRKGNMS
jgi:hypothetical protein